MKYKMLVLDMDDTLLNDDHTISNENKEMLFKAKEKGVHIILASRKTYACNDALCTRTRIR